MIKMNNRGFAVSTILYGILVLTILILMLIFGVMKSNKDMNSGLAESITDAMDKCVELETKLETCYLNGDGDCENELEQYQACINGNDETEPDDNTTPDIQCESGSNKLKCKILQHNDEVADNDIDFGAETISDAEKGLYYTSVNTEKINKVNGTTYYFRGAVDNNIVQFGTNNSGNELYWKIVRINEDGSIRLIYNGTSATSTGTATVLSVGTMFTNSGIDNTYAGYMYGLNVITTNTTTYNQAHENNNNSIIKGKIDTWYKNNLKENYGKYISDTGFCNDRSISSSAGLWNDNDTALGYSTKETYYGAYNRLENNKEPQFKCENADNDLFTTSSASHGNKALTYPVGLLTADEALYAGVMADCYLNSTVAYWTMTPSHYNSNINVFYVQNYSNMVAGSASSSILKDYTYARPVINLNEDVVLTDDLPRGCTEQIGTAKCPYVVDTSAE